MKDLMVRTNGIRLHVQDYENNGEAVILIHYGGGTCMCWNGVIPYFKGNYHIVNIEMRGHGKSDKPEEEYDIDTMALDLVGAMDELGIDRAHIVGSSLGGEVAVATAANHPERVISITCEGAIQNPFGKDGIFDIPKEDIPEKINECLERARNNPIPIYDTREEMLKKTKEHCISWNELMEKGADYDVFQTEDGRYTQHWTQRSRMQYLKAYWNTDFESYFKRIKCPVLFLPSESESKQESIRNTLMRFSQYIEVFKVVEIKGAQHAATMYYYPEEWQPYELLLIWITLSWAITTGVIAQIDVPRVYAHIIVIE